MSRGKKNTDAWSKQFDEQRKSWQEFIAKVNKASTSEPTAKTTTRPTTQRKSEPILRDEDETDVERKYYLTNQMKEVTDDKGHVHKLHRIVAAHDIPAIGVEEGDFGGYIESDKNLSHRGLCWVFDGCVFGQARVKDGATVRGEDVRVYDNATLSDGFTAYDSVKLHGNFRGNGCAKACKYADCADNSMQTGSSYVTGFTIMRGNSKVRDNARAEGNTHMGGTAEFRGDFVSVGGSYMHNIMGQVADQPDAPSGR